MSYISSTKRYWERWCPTAQQSVTFLVVVATSTLLLALSYDQWTSSSFLASRITAIHATVFPSTRRQASLLDVDCKCHSMFTIGACDMSAVISNNPKSKGWVRTLTGLKDARLGKPLSITDRLQDLSRYLPSILQSKGKNIYKKPNETETISEYPFIHNATHVDTLSEQREKMENIISKMSKSPPFLECNVHVYSEQEIETCLRKREVLTGRVLKIAFVGDSQVRNMLEQMILHLRVQLDLKVGDDRGLNLTTGFLNMKTKYDLPVLGTGVELRLYWSSFIARNREETVSEQGALDLFKVWAQNRSTEKGEDVPDILYFDDGMWANGMETESGAVDLVYGDFHTLVPYFKNMSRTSRLILRTQTPVKHWVAKNNIPNAGLDLMNQAGWIALRDAGVWIWDSVTPYYLREFNDCWAHWRTDKGLNLPALWACHDFQHPSKIAEGVAANFLWNYICNDVMDLSVNHCCSR